LKEYYDMMIAFGDDDIKKKLLDESEVSILR
jgi:hypothetical protein